MSAQVFRCLGCSAEMPIWKGDLDKIASGKPKTCPFCKENQMVPSDPIEPAASDAPPPEAPSIQGALQEIHSEGTWLMARNIKRRRTIILQPGAKVYRKENYDDAWTEDHLVPVDHIQEQEAWTEGAFFVWAQFMDVRAGHVLVYRVAQKSKFITRG